MEGDLKIGVYCHYKGAFYEVIGVVWHSEMLEEMVVYRAPHGDPADDSRVLWVRPKSMFCENVLVNGVQKPCFEFIKEHS